MQRQVSPSPFIVEQPVLRYASLQGEAVEDMSCSEGHHCIQRYTVHHMCAIEIVQGQIGIEAVEVRPDEHCREKVSHLYADQIDYLVSQH